MMDHKLSADERFNIAIQFVLLHEGGYIDDIQDKGGATKYGISLRFLKNNGLDIDVDGDIDVNDIIALDKQKAIDIYRKKFWDQYGFNDIVSLNVAKKVFDISVNAGPKKAIQILQLAINSLGGNTLSVDGILGPVTLRSANLWGDNLLPRLQEKLKAFYECLVISHPELKIYLKGWLNRAYD